MCQQPHTAWGNWPRKERYYSLFNMYGHSSEACFCIIIIFSKWTNDFMSLGLKEVLGAGRQTQRLRFLTPLTSSASFLLEFYRQISPFHFQPNQLPFIPLECGHRECVCARANCVSEREPQHLCLRATKSIGSYQEGRGWRRTVPSQEGVLRPLKEMLKVHVYSPGVHERGRHARADAHVRTHCGA